MTETIQLLERDEPEFSFDRTPDEEPWHLLAQTTRRDIEPIPFTRVRIGSMSGIRVFGVLKATGRGEIQVLTTIPVTVHCPLEIAVEGCQPTAGEAYYRIKRSSVFLAGIVLSSHQKPGYAVDSPAIMRDLESPLVSYRGTILEVGDTSVSVLSKTAIPPGARVRLESSGWVLFGVVTYAVPAGTSDRSVRVHLEAVFRVDPRRGKAIPETHILRSFPKLQPWTPMDRESPLQEAIL
jgi:hypothetical protein